MFVHRMMDGAPDVFEEIGLNVAYDIEAGKLMKRLSVFGVSQGAFAWVGDRMDEVDDLNVLVEDNRPEADGGMMIGVEFARQLLREGGVPVHRLPGYDDVLSYLTGHQAHTLEQSTRAKHPQLKPGESVQGVLHVRHAALTQ